ncbi:MAG: hypothetical protein P9M14_01090 [Candidatus Alcyoniella australis]|nr:hypothetical protein [Candidatus Alcyoniella australis]
MTLPNKQIVTRGLPTLLVLALLLAGCAGSTNHFGVISAGRAGLTDYEVGKLGDDWQRYRLPDADHVYINRANGSSILANATCEIENRIPLVALTNHLLVDFTHRVIVKQEELVIDGRTALRTELQAQLDGAPIQICIYVVQIDSCIYDLCFAAHPDYFADQLVEFEEFVTDFHARRTD